MRNELEPRFVLTISELDDYLSKAGPHKYISKKMVRGKWVYEYHDDAVKRVVDLLLDFLSNPARSVTLGQVARSFRVNKNMAKEVVDSLVAQKKIVGTKNAKGLLEYRQTIPEEVKPKPVVRKQVKPVEKPKQVKVDPSLWHIESVGGGPKEYYLTDEGARKADSIGSGYTESKAALLRELAARGGKSAIERIVGGKVYLTPFGEDFSGLDLLHLTGDGAIESVDPMPGYGRTYRLTDKGRDKIERMDDAQDDLLRRVRNTEKPEKVKEAPKVYFLNLPEESQNIINALARWKDVGLSPYHMAQKLHMSESDALTRMRELEDTGFVVPVKKNSNLIASMQLYRLTTEAKKELGMIPSYYDKPEIKGIKQQLIVRSGLGMRPGPEIEFTGRTEFSMGADSYEFKYLSGPNKGITEFTHQQPITAKGRGKKEEPPKVLIEPPKKTKKELKEQKVKLQREANKIHGEGGQLSLDFTVKLETIDDKIVNADVDENAEKVVAELNKPETPKKKEPKKKKTKSEDDGRFTKDVGEHVWGSRADLAVDRVPLPLADLPTHVQAKQCVKAKLLPKVSNDELLDRGCTPECVLLRRAVEKCIAAKAGDSLKARQYYMNGIDFVARSLDACKTGQDVVDFLGDWHYLGQGKTRRATYSKEDIFMMRYAHAKENIPQIAQYLKAEPEEMLALHTEGRKLDNEINELRFANFMAFSNEQTPESLEREKLREGKEKELSKINERLFDMGATRLNGVPVNGVLAKKFGVSERDVDFDQKGHGDSRIVNVYVKDDSIEQSVKDNAYAQYTAGLGSNMIKLAGKRQREDYGPKAYKDAYKLTQEWNRKKLTPEERETHMFASLKAKSVKRRPVFTWEKNVPGEINRSGGMPIEGEVDVDRLHDTFNLQNIQQGNWMKNDVEAAKSHLNGTYGGFLDLAELVGIDPKTVGLNGRLSIGFGARGEGMHSGKAHYEKGGKIINMTKFAGGGSLAHEWAHAIDHIMYVSRNPQDKSDHAFMSEGKTENVPQDVVEAHRAVMDAIKYSDPELANIVRRGEKVRASRKFPRSKEETKIIKEYYRAKDSIRASEFFEDAIALSGPNGYYARNREMFARAFECYVEDTLTKKGRKSSYLVSGTQDKYKSNRHTTEKNVATGKDAQVYPHGEIRKRITDAVDNLVKVLAKSKVLEKSLRLLDEQFFIKAG